MGILKKFLTGLFIVIVLLAVVFFLGPRPQFKELDNTPLTKVYEIDEIEPYLAEMEADEAYLKPDNQARVVWFDSIPQKTPYSLVYLHGFSASQGEGFPIHQNLAKRFKCNLMLSRLEDHGLNSREAFNNLDPAEWVEDAKTAIAIGKSIGEKVILMSCSTGGTLSIFLAANDPDIAALILLSPNIDIFNPSSDMITGPWGRQLAYQIMGEYRRLPRDEQSAKYWSNEYHTDGLIALQGLLDQTMIPAIFKSIKMPVYCGFYYKNEQEQDFVVSVEAMRDFETEISTPSELVEFEAFPEAGNHVIGSVYKSDNYDQVEKEIGQFLVEKLGVKGQ